MMETSTQPVRREPAPTQAAKNEIASAQNGRRTRSWIKVILATALAAIVLLVGALIIMIYREARSMDTGPSGAIVVLGAAQFNGTPSQVFQARLDTAKKLYDEGAAPLIVVSGGRLAGDQFTEAQAGRDYLVSQGVPAEAIQMEYLSNDTKTNLSGVAHLLRQEGISSILIVSDGFHLFRAQKIAHDNGLDSSAHASENSPIEHGSLTEFEYVLRETAAVIGDVTGLD